MAEFCDLRHILGTFSNLRTIFQVYPKRVASVTSRVLNKLPKDGILCEGLIAYPIAYNCSKRVVVMSHNPDKIRAIYETSLAIDEFKLNYAVFSDSWVKDIAYGYPVIEYIKSFNLIKTVKENGERYYIYEVPPCVTS